MKSFSGFPPKFKVKWSCLSFNISLQASLGPSSRWRGPKSVPRRAEIRVSAWSSRLDLRREGILGQCPGKKGLQKPAQGQQLGWGHPGGRRQHKRLARSEPKSKPPKCSLPAELEHQGNFRAKSSVARKYVPLHALRGCRLSGL